MVTIVFESHSTSLDNEKHLASGHNDVDLSLLGIEQAQDLGKRYSNERFDAIFCSDLKRSYKTAYYAFYDRFPIIKDNRLRECNYGDFTKYPEDEVRAMKVNHISVAFPNGESYEQTANRMKEFLNDLLKNYDNNKVMIIGHRATQYGLEHWIKNVSLKDCLTAEWKWQPGWVYKLEKI